MPELPEVEITARRIDRAVKGAAVESALAPGMVTMKTFDPPVDSLTGRTITGVSRRGKMPVVEFDDELALLIHLMSAGRLQTFDKRASLRDKASRLLIRLPGERDLRLREVGAQQGAGARGGCASSGRSSGIGRGSFRWRAWIWMTRWRPSARRVCRCPRSRSSA